MKTERPRLRRRRIPELTVRNFGPVRSADVRFGDLTVFVGPQATGKSLMLQLLRLAVDLPQIKAEFKRAGVDWDGQFKQFLEVYFGEGMGSLWRKGKTQVEFNGNTFDLPAEVENTKAKKGDRMFFIPAQRVLALRDGWPQAFTYYDPGVPFAVREFSEELRLFVNDLGTSEKLFPIPRWLKNEFRELLQRHLFPNFDLKVDTQRAQKRLVLAGDSDGSHLPFVVWSAGQREFVPLLLGLYWLMPSAGSPKRKGIDWVVIEELEMGLHPKAISVVMLMVMELVTRGYRVCLSTHSPQILDAVWAIKHLRENEASPEALLHVFDVDRTQPMMRLAERIMQRSSRIHYFDREDGATKDISNLDPSAEEQAEAGWGGLAEFSSRANEQVAKAVARKEVFG